MRLLPMKMHPFYAQYLWGGKLLKTYYNKKDAPSITAESWELSANKDGLSYVEEGLYKDKTLEMLYEEDNSIFGTKVEKNLFPLLIKLIDANQDLSIQVHPSDINAIKELGESGKEEVWYIIDCKDESFIYFGFAKNTDREEVRKRIEDGSICSILNKVKVKKGDFFLIKPGTLHAICQGILIAEIQQNSNTTFRVYDYNRKGPDGKFRQLHIERALDVMNYNQSTITNQTQKELVSKYFKVQVVDVDNQKEFCCEKASFEHLLCVNGNLSIIFEDSSYEMKTGESYFIPAGMGQYLIKGNGKLIITRLPD